MTGARPRPAKVLLIGICFVSGMITAACAADPKTDDETSSEPAVEAAAREIAPELALLEVGGDSVSLEGYRGQVVLLNIWATWCIPCRDEMPVLQALHSAQTPNGLTVIGVSVDARGEEERIRAFLQENGITYPVWLDPDETAPLLFRAIGVPNTYLIDRSGAIVWKRVGPLEEGDPGLTLAIREALERG